MKKRILVFPCGSEIGLEIHAALKYSTHVELWGGASVEDHGRFLYKNYIGNMPSVNESDFIESINDIVKTYQIDLIFPAHDSVVLALAEHENIIDAKLITSGEKVCAICRSKRKTYDLLRDTEFVPQQFENYSEVSNFPVFVKPDIGQGSNGALKIETAEELEYALLKDKSLLVLEYLPGREYTVDCFTDRHGNLRFCGQRERVRIKAGISVNSKITETSSEVDRIAECINSRLAFRGAWFFQIKKDKLGKFKLLEASPRIAGTMSVYRNLGINFPLLSVFDHLGYDVSITKNNYQLEVDRAFTNRYSIDLDYNRVYIDFDDTIFDGNSVNEYVVMFIYQCLNESKELVLLTKHNKDIYQTLKKIRLDASVFHRIEHIGKDDKKYCYIDTEIKSIFVDDSFAERNEVKERCGIATFDLDSLESLINWKR